MGEVACARTDDATGDDRTMSQTNDGFELRDSLIALPPRFLLLIACIPLIAVGLGGYLIVSTGSDSVRTAAILLITLSAPALTVAVGLAAAARVRTDDIDRLVTAWLVKTVQEKLSCYLMGAADSPVSRLHPPLFRNVRAYSDPATSSFCLFELIDFDGSPYFLYVKSNVYNVEIGAYFALTGIAGAIPGDPIHITDLERWAAYLDDPRVRCVADTLHGSISEGYRIYISGGRNSDGDYVTYRLRQKLDTGFITSPYTRRYFAEDIAIASYWLHSEIRRAASITVAGSCGPLLEQVDGEGTSSLGPSMSPMSSTADNASPDPPRASG
jgi:hypothetical protein